MKRSAFDESLNWLTKAGRTTFEVTQYLEKKGFNETEIVDTISRLTQLGYLNDSMERTSTIETRLNRLEGPLKINTRLAQRGLASTESRVNVVEQGFKLLAKRFPHAQQETNPKTWAKAARILTQNGYDEDDVRDILESYFKSIEI